MQQSASENPFDDLRDRRRLVPERGMGAAHDHRGGHRVTRRGWILVHPPSTRAFDAGHSVDSRYRGHRVRKHSGSCGSLGRGISATPARTDRSRTSGPGDSRPRLSLAHDSSQAGAREARAAVPRSPAPATSPRRLSERSSDAHQVEPSDAKGWERVRQGFELYGRVFLSW